MRFVAILGKNVFNTKTGENWYITKSAYKMWNFIWEIWCYREKIFQKNVGL